MTPRRVNLTVLACCAALLVLSGTVRAQVVLWDLQTLEAVSIGDPLAALGGLGCVDGVAALDLDGRPGDELLLLLGDGRMVGIEIRTATVQLDAPLDLLRALWGLPSGTGSLASLAPPGIGELLLHRDGADGTTYQLRLADGAAGPYSGPPLPGGFATGLGGSGSADELLLWRTEDWAGWSLRPLQGGPDQPLDLTAPLGMEPWTITELRVEAPGEIRRYLLACSRPDAAEPTPTPVASPTLTPTPQGTPHPIEAILVNGLGETLSTVSRARPRTVENDVVNVGQGASQVLLWGDRVLVLNSLSHSIGVYGLADLALQREISIGIGTNPFKMVLFEPDLAFVTRMVAEDVAVVDLAAGAVIDQIPLPSTELPRDAGVDRTWARPTGLILKGDRVFVACPNLTDEWIAGGPGVVAEIDAVGRTLLGWFESGGRDTLDLAAHPWDPDGLLCVNAGDYVPGTGFAGNGSVTLLSLSTRAVIHTFPTGEAPFEMVIAPHGRAYLGNGMRGWLLRLDLESGGVMPPIQLPGGAPGMSFASGLALGTDGLLWTLELNSDTLSIFDTLQGDALVEGPYQTGWGPDALVLVP